MISVATTVGNRYRIDARIGGGGMADVFEARDEALNRDVALKLLRGIDDEAAARRFAEEIRLTARLNHPNVVQLFDAGEHDGSPYLVLERVTGGTLSQLMADGPLPPAQVAAIGRQTADGLEHAHAEGIVHRDVKPSNILLTTDGTVRLADFGIALTATATRLTVAGSVAGSAGYVSPEQVLGTGAGAPSDVYALGLVLLECLTGAPPWTGTTVEVALARITADPPIPETVPESWRGLLTVMLARRPEDRPPMGLVAAALADLAAGRPTMVFPAPRVPKEPRRVPLPVAVVGALLLLAAGGTLALNRPPAPPTTASAAPATSTTGPAAPQGLIAASVVRAAAVGEAAPDEDDPLDPIDTLEELRDELRPTSAEPASSSGSEPDSQAPSASSGGATGASAPAPPAPRAPAPEREREPTRTETEPKAPAPPPDDEPADTTPEDTSDDGEVAEDSGPGKSDDAKASKARSPEVPLRNGVEVGK